LLEEANGKVKQQSQQVGELERLVLDQHTMIESIQQRYNHTENQEELLMAAQEQLKIVSAENAKWQSKFQRLEDNSKYLANQIDELLPQLALKNVKILQLENQVKDFEPKTPPTLVDSESQTDCDLHEFSKLPLPSLEDDQVMDDQPVTSPSPRAFPGNETPPVPIMSELVEMKRSEEITSPPPERRSRKSKSHPTQQPGLTGNFTTHFERKSTKHRAAKQRAPVAAPVEPSRSVRSSDISPPFRPTRTLFEVSQDNDLYNQSLEIYGSSLFDIVERMEELESTLRSATSSGRKR
jgi:hypothetical protein